MSGRTFEWGPWQFERAEWRLRHATTGVVSLPNKTLELLALLVERAPRLVTKEEILASVWPDTVVEEGNIAFHVAMLRKVLDTDGQPSAIETVRARGYRFVVPLNVRAAAGETTPVEAPAEPRVRRMPGWAVAAIAATGMVLAGLAWFAMRNQEGAFRSIAIAPFTGSSPATRGPFDSEFAKGVATRIADVTAIRAEPLPSIPEGESALSAGRIARVEAVMDGSALRIGDHWRVSVHLTRTADGLRVWSWAFDVVDGGPATMNAEIAERIAVGLGRQLGASRRPLAISGTASVEAYDVFLQARAQWRLRTPASIRQAMALYKRAIAIDPSFAQAYAGLADCYNLTMSGLPPAERYPAARTNAERAVALAPDQAEGHTSLAFLRYKFEWKWADAEAEFKRAIGINPRYPLAHHWYGEYLGLMGRFDDGVRELRVALELEPKSQAILADLAATLHRAGRTAEARRVLEEAEAINPDWQWIFYRRAMLLQDEGREKEGLENYWKWMLMTGASLDAVDDLRDAYRRGGRVAMTRAEIRHLLASEAAAPGAFRVAMDLSMAYARIGERADALKWLAVSIDRREDAAIHLLTNPDYASIRGEPEFRVQLERVGLK